MITTEKFAIFILTNARPEKQLTYKTLGNMGCSADIYLVIDTDDKYAKKYRELYNNVISFDKKDIAGTFDIMDNFGGFGTVVFARNALNDIAKSMGLDYYFVLDDDYTGFDFRINSNNEYPHKQHWGVKNIDAIINSLLDYYKSAPMFTSIALSQGGDWIGGSSFKKYRVKRKVMNTFIFSTSRPYYFPGRINEDVNMYVDLGQRGYVFLQIPFASVNQPITQTNSGGLTEFYLETGTYVKSFYTVMLNPSAVSIGLMGNINFRLHHKINWNNACPRIIREEHKK